MKLNRPFDNKHIDTSGLQQKRLKYLDEVFQNKLLGNIILNIPYISDGRYQLEDMSYNINTITPGKKKARIPVNKYNDAIFYVLPSRGKKIALNISKIDSLNKKYPDFPFLFYKINIYNRVNNLLFIDDTSNVIKTQFQNEIFYQVDSFYRDNIDTYITDKGYIDLFTLRMQQTPDGTNIWSYRLRSDNYIIALNKKMFTTKTEREISPDNQLLLLSSEIMGYKRSLQMLYLFFFQYKKTDSLKEIEPTKDWEQDYIGLITLSDYDSRDVQLIEKRKKNISRYSFYSERYKKNMKLDFDFENLCIKKIW
jgi:hypothetical protein